MTRRHRWALAALGALAAAAASCAPITVTSFVDRNVDLSRYRSYDWETVSGAVPGDPRLENNPFFHDYVRGAIDRQLVARGYEQTVLGPDLRVHYHASATQRISITDNTTATTVCRDCAAQVYDEGTLLVDLVDGRTGALVWRSSAQADIAGAVADQTRMEQLLDRMCARLFDRLPRQNTAER